MNQSGSLSRRQSRVHIQASDNAHVIIFSLYAVFTLAAAEGIRELLAPPAEYFNTLNLPEVRGVALCPMHTTSLILL